LLTEMRRAHANDPEWHSDADLVLDELERVEAARKAAVEGWARDRAAFEDLAERSWRSGVPWVSRVVRRILNSGSV
jgi:Xaa-Pro aminopeptidase